MPAYNFINFDAFTNTPKYRLIETKGKVWDNVAKALSFTTVYANSLITLAENAVINGVPVTLPADLPTGDFYMMFYDAETPANTDAYTRWYRIGWNHKSKEINYMVDMGPMS